MVLQKLSVILCAVSELESHCLASFVLRQTQTPFGRLVCTPLTGATLLLKQFEQASRMIIPHFVEPFSSFCIQYGSLVFVEGESGRFSTLLFNLKKRL